MKRQYSRLTCSLIHTFHQLTLRLLMRNVNGCHIRAQKSGSNRNTQTPVAESGGCSAPLGNYNQLCRSSTKHHLIAAITTGM